MPSLPSDQVLTVTASYSARCDVSNQEESSYKDDVSRPSILKAQMWPSLLPLLTWAIQGSLATPTPVNSTADMLQSRAPSGSKTVIIQMFEWTWYSRPNHQFFSRSISLLSPGLASQRSAPTSSAPLVMDLFKVPSVSFIAAMSLTL